MERDYEERRIFGETVIHNMRIDADLTQEELAERMGLHPNTIHKWESGENCPNAVQAFKLYRACGIYQAPYVLAYQHPEWLAGDFDPSALHMLLDSYPVERLKQIYAILSHPNAFGLIDLILCHMELPLKGRIPSASIVAKLHELSEMKGSLECLYTGPDMENLQACLNAAEKAISEGKDTYTLR